VYGDLFFQTQGRVFMGFQRTQQAEGFFVVPLFFIREDDVGSYTVGQLSETHRIRFSGSFLVIGQRLAIIVSFQVDVANTRFCIQYSLKNIILLTFFFYFEVESHRFIRPLQLIGKQVSDIVFGGYLVGSWQRINYVLKIIDSTVGMGRDVQNAYVAEGCCKLVEISGLPKIICRQPLKCECLFIALNSAVYIANIDTYGSQRL